MRALTIWQPFTGLIASEIKLIENRPMKRPGRPAKRPKRLPILMRRQDIGVRFALHAGREVDEIYYDTIREIAPELYDGWHPSDEASWPAWYRLSRITSAAIATARVERIAVLQDDGIELRDYYTGELVEVGEQRRWAFGPICYLLRDVVVLDTPVPCRGYQGFWTLLPATARAITDQIASAA